MRKTQQMLRKENIKRISLIFILLFAIIILLGTIVNIFPIQKPTEKAEDKKEINVTHLSVVFDPSCTTCQVDFYIHQLEKNLFDDLEVEMIESNSQEGKEIIKDTGSKFLPIFLFERDIMERDDWKVRLRNAFEVSGLDDEKHFLLKPQYLPSKELVQDPLISEGTIFIDNGAQLTVYEYNDYTCKFCALSHANEPYLQEYRNSYPSFSPAIPKIWEEYVDSGMVNYVFINLNKDSLGEDAHLSALCADEQQKWHEYSELLFMRQQEWGRKIDAKSDFYSYAEEVGMNKETFRTCLDEKRHLGTLEEEEKLSDMIDSVPTLVIGRQVVSAVEDYETIKKIIDARIKK